jgi:hypothetical protein
MLYRHPTLFLLVRVQPLHYQPSFPSFAAFIFNLFKSMHVDEQGNVQLHILFTSDVSSGR